MKRGVRIGAGTLRGRALPVAPGIRPSGARLRESLFDVWQGRVPASRFLDLFAGTGAVGLEAISRGACRAVLVEGGPKAFTMLRNQCARLAPQEASVLRLELPGDLARLATAGQRFDLVFADPPYDFPHFEELLAGLSALLAPDGEAAIEHSTRLELATPAGLSRRELRTYGEHRLSFYRLSDCAKGSQAGSPRSTVAKPAASPRSGKIDSGTR